MPSPRWTPFLQQKLEVSCRYIHVKLPPTLPFWIAQRTTWRPKSQHRVQSLTFRNSLCTAPITLRRAAPGHLPPFIISFFLKDFSLLRSLAALFPRGLLLDWLGFNYSALPVSGWNFTFSSPPPLPSGAATTPGDFWGTAINNSLSLSLYCCPGVTLWCWVVCIHMPLCGYAWCRPADSHLFPLSPPRFQRAIFLRSVLLSHLPLFKKKYSVAMTFLIIPFLFLLTY